jgi:hypothetical protein
MRIFEEDETIDNLESNKRLSENGMNRVDLDGGLGIHFSSDFNLFRKKHGKTQSRD